MVHDCPDCGLYCDCDMEDTHLDAPPDCRHECEEEITPDFDPSGGCGQ